MDNELSESLKESRRKLAVLNRQIADAQQIVQEASDKAAILAALIRDGEDKGRQRPRP